MAILPMGPHIDNHENMFEEPIGFPESHLEPATDEVTDLAPDDAVEDRTGSESHAELGDENDSLALPLTLDDFSALEERVLRAVSLVRRERLARLAAEEQVSELKAQIHANVLEQAPILEKLAQLEQDVDALQSERQHVRQRVDRLLSQLDAMEL